MNFTNFNFIKIVMKHSELLIKNIFFCENMIGAISFVFT